MTVKNFRSGLDLISNVLCGIGGSEAAIIAQHTFYVLEFTCKECGHKQQTIYPCSANLMPFSFEYIAFKFWWENFKKCPECGKKNWNVKIIGKKHPWDLPMGQDFL